MANIILTVNYTNDVLNQMRCSICKGYLSCSPICVLPDGGCICGRCTPPNSDVQVYRALPFEILLSQLSFPCQFKERGCQENVLFDQVADHESKCIYRSFICPSLTSCDWEGFTSEVNNHFTEQHPELIKENANFKFKMNEDIEDVFITTKDNVLFVIKYLYNVYENCLKYDVRYFRNVRKDEGTYKVQLINDADSDCTFSLKTNKCLVFDNSFCDARNAGILKLSKYLEILDNPSKVKVIINLEIVETSDDSGNQEIKLVDYKLLETIRCKKCRNYLIPPIFDMSIGTVCYNCAKLYSLSNLSTNAELIKLLSQINYPCQWRNCNFIGNHENIRRHNFTCEFRLYRCMGLECQAFISLATAAEHLRSHDDFQFLPDGVYRIILSKDYNPTFIWTIKNGTLIVIKHSVAYTYSGRSPVVSGQKLELLSDLMKFTVTVRFEHQHCNLKSEPFFLVSNSSQIINCSQLPFCYKDTDELSLRIC